MFDARPHRLLFAAFFAIWLSAPCAFVQAPLESASTKPPAQQSGDNSAQQENSPADPPATIFPHSESSRFWISGQANFITQWHGAFTSPYQSAQSLRPAGENATSRVMTLYLGAQITQNVELLFDLESAGGRGIR